MNHFSAHWQIVYANLTSFFFKMKVSHILPTEAVNESQMWDQQTCPLLNMCQEKEGNFWRRLYSIFAPLTDISEKLKLKGTSLKVTLRYRNQCSLYSTTLTSLFERYLKYSLVSPRNLYMFKKQQIIYDRNKPYLWFTTTQTVMISTLNLFDLGVKYSDECYPAVCHKYISGLNSQNWNPEKTIKCWQQKGRPLKNTLQMYSY